MGAKITLSQIALIHVSIEHRDPDSGIQREVFNGQNKGSLIVSAARERPGYEQHREWPLVNRFPSQDITYQPTAEEVDEYCEEYTVLPDWWKFQVLQLQCDKRYTRWKLDFTREGWLARNFTPHGAAAVRKDSLGRLRFVIWNGYELHGDIGERLGLPKKVPVAQLRGFENIVGPEAHIAPIGDKDSQSWCLGNVCPAEYQFPMDWDVLGQLPPRKKRKLDAERLLTTPFNPINSPGGPFPNGIIRAYTKRDRPIKSPHSPRHLRREGNTGQDTPKSPSGGTLNDPRSLRREENTNAGDSPVISTENTNIPGSSPRTVNTPVTSPPRQEGNTTADTLPHAPKFPKTQIPIEASSEEIASLQNENAKLRDMLDYANAKIKAVVTFGAYQDGVVSRLADRFKAWKTEKTYAGRLRIEKEINEIIKSSDTAVARLADEFPELEGLVSQHADGQEETELLGRWRRREDCIQFPGAVDAESTE